MRSPKKVMPDRAFKPRAKDVMKLLDESISSLSLPSSLRGSLNASQLQLRYDQLPRPLKNEPVNLAHLVLFVEVMLDRLDEL